MSTRADQILAVEEAELSDILRQIQIGGQHVTKLDSILLKKLDKRHAGLQKAYKNFSDMYWANRKEIASDLEKKIGDE